MIANELALPSSAAATVVADVARFGTVRVETGGFLLAPRDSDAVTVVALAGGAGIVRRRDLFQISDLALDRLFAHADKHDLWIPAQFHSHGLGAFMSECDVEHGLSVAGFVTTIVPYFSAPPADPADWGWWHYDGEWAPIAAPRATTAPATVIRFDEDGVGEA